MKGLAGFRTAKREVLQPLQVGMVLHEGAIVQTGSRGRLELSFGLSRPVVVGPMVTVTLSAELKPNTRVLGASSIEATAEENLRTPPPRRVMGAAR